MVGSIKAKTFMYFNQIESWVNDFQQKVIYVGLPAETTSVMYVEMAV